MVGAWDIFRTRSDKKKALRRVDCAMDPDSADPDLVSEDDQVSAAAPVSAATSVSAAGPAFGPFPAFGDVRGWLEYDMTSISWVTLGLAEDPADEDEMLLGYGSDVGEVKQPE